MELKEGEKIETLMIEDFKIIQSDKLYRFTSDAVLLSRFALCRRGERVADLCSGSGIVGLHFYALNHPKVRSVSLFELQSGLAEMSARSVELNGLGEIFTVYNTPIQKIGESLNGAFSLILCNPPYKKYEASAGREPTELDVCKSEIAVTLDEICSTAARLLCFGGRLCICNRAERLADVITSLNRFGLNVSRIKLVSGRIGAQPYLVMAEAVKGRSPRLKVSLEVNSARDFSGEIENVP